MKVLFIILLSLQSSAVLANESQCAQLLYLLSPEYQEGLFLQCMDQGVTECEKQGYSVVRSNCSTVIKRQCKQALGAFEVELLQKLPLVCAQ